MKPTDRALLLALAVYTDGWAAADEVRGVLVSWGFDCTAQQVAARLTRLGRWGARVQVDRERWPWGNAYRLDARGDFELEAHFRGGRLKLLGARS